MKTYYGGPIGTYQRSLERYHPRLPTASPSPRLGVRNSKPKLQSLLSQELVKLRTAKNVADAFTGSIEQKSMKKFGEKGAWAHPGTAQIFRVPPIISGMDKKATNFRFCRHIYRIDRNISPLKISAKVAVGVLRDCRKFS